MRIAAFNPAPLCHVRWILSLCLLSSSLLLCASCTKIAQAETAPANPVATVLLELPDNQRDKVLPLKVYYPTVGSGLPVIVFSHGLGGNREVGPELMEHWARHGFVVICPTHEDSVQWRRAQGLSTTKFGLLREFSRNDQPRLIRVADDVLVLDALDWIEREVPMLAGRIDHERLGIGGHSAGAMTTQQLAGARMNMPEGATQASYHEPRFDCALVLSGQGIGGSGFTTESWEPLSLPLMVMTGSEDYAVTRQDPRARCQPFEYAPPGDKYLVYIEDAVHMSFTGDAATWARRLMCESPLTRLEQARLDFSSVDIELLKTTDQEEIFGYVMQSSLVFWEAYLLDDTTAQAWLKSDALAETANGQVEYRHK